MISDGTAEIIIDPTQESLSFETQKKTVTGAHRVSEEIDVEKVDMDPSADVDDSGSVPNPIELIEGTISTGEDITVVGKANPASNGAIEETSIDANAVMTPDTGHLNIIDNLTGTTAVKKGARGVLLSVVGSVFLLGCLVLLLRISVVCCDENKVVFSIVITSRNPVPETVRGDLLHTAVRQSVINCVNCRIMQIHETTHTQILIGTGSVRRSPEADTTHHGFR
jgi:hypothetical protein